MSTLYSDEHPDKSLKNTGYKNKSSAIETLRLIKLRSLHYQFTVINTMYYRAKNHKNKTKEMEEAMKVYKLWLDNYPEKKEREVKLTIEKINTIINKLDKETIKIIKNLTTVFKGTPKDSATNLNPPTSLSIPMLLFLISLMCVLYETIESFNTLIFVLILDCSLLVDVANLNELLLVFLFNTVVLLACN